MPTAFPFRFNAAAFAFGAMLIARSSLAVEAVSVTDAPTQSNHYQFTVVSSYRATQGKFDAYGDYNAFPDGSSVWGWYNQFLTSYRFSHSFELGGTLSIRESESTYPSGTLSSASFGMPTFEGRYHVSTPFAHLMFHAGFSLPYKWNESTVAGDPSRDSQTSDDLGDSLYSGLALRAGIGVIKRIRPLNLRAAIDLTVVQPFASSSAANDAPPNDPVTQSVLHGRQYSLSEGLAYLFGDAWSINSGLRQLWAEGTSIDGDPVAGTSARAFTANLGVTYNSLDDWRVTGTYETAWPFYAYLANQPYAPSFSLALTYTGI